MLVLVCALVLAGETRPADLPRFEQFAAAEAFRGMPAHPRLRTQRQLLYRTAIYEGAEKGPNFAGRFTIVGWGCGSSCEGNAVVDAATGAIYDMPFTILSFGAPLRYLDGSVGLKPDFEELSYRLNSRLLIVRGCPEEESTRCGVYYYEWTGSQFRLLRSLIGGSPAVYK